MLTDYLSCYSVNNKSSPFLRRAKFTKTLKIVKFSTCYHHQNTSFVMKLAKLVRYFFLIHVRANLRSTIGNRIHLERFKKILCISEIFGSRGGGIEILTMIGVQK